MKRKKREEKKVPIKDRKKVKRKRSEENIENTGDQETIVYNLMFERENILNKSILHKVWSKTTLSDLHKFMLFHLIENFPFNLPHTFYIK